MLPTPSPPSSFSTAAVWKTRVGRRVGLVDGFIDEVGDAGVHVELAGLFFERHAREQVAHTIFDGQVGLLVGRVGFDRRGRLLSTQTSI